MSNHPTSATIDIPSLRHNISLIRNKIGPTCQLLTVVKANAYGHGAIELASYLQKMNIDMLGVAYVDEGCAIRKAGIKLPVLVMGGALSEEIESAIINDLTLSISDVNTARAINTLASRLKRSAKVHIDIDTGMGRLGLKYEEAKKSIIDINKLRYISLEGIFTHLATSEDEDYDYTNYQFDRFMHLREAIVEKGHKGIKFHIANSGAVIQHPLTYLDLVRVGIMIYGVAPTARLQTTLPIKPIMSLKTRIIQIKRMSCGESISYNRSYICKSDKLIGVIPVGYADGLAKSMSNKAHVLVNGIRAHILGTICMDLSIIDLTDVGEADIGHEVILIGNQGKASITVHDWAQWQDTIPYEVLCSIGMRVKRVYI